MDYYIKQGKLFSKIEHFDNDDIIENYTNQRCKGYWSECTKKCGGGTKRWTTTSGNCNPFKTGYVIDCNTNNCPTSRTLSPAPAPSRTPAPAPSRTPSRTPAPAPSRTPAPSIKHYDEPSTCRCCKYNTTGILHTLSCGCCDTKNRACNKSCNSSCACKSSDNTILTLNNCNNGVKNDNGVLKCN
jgi:hypothetical protein